MYGLHKVGGLNRISKVPVEGHNNSLAYVMSEWAKQQSEKQGCRVSIPTMHEGNTVDGLHVSDFGAFGQPYRLEDAVALSGNSNSIFNSLKVSGQTIPPGPVHFNTVGKVSGFNFDKSWPENNVPAVPKFSSSRDSLSPPTIKTPSVSSASLSVSSLAFPTAACIQATICSTNMETHSELTLALALLHMDLEQALTITSLEPQVMAMLLMTPEEMWMVSVS